MGHSTDGEHREAHRALDRRSEVHGIGGGDEHRSADELEALAHPLRDAQVVDLACCLEALRDRHRFVEIESALDQLARFEANAHHQVGAHRAAHPVEHLQQQPHPVLERPSVGVRALVGDRRKKLVDQVPVAGVDLDAVEASLLHVTGTGDVSVEIGVDVRLLHLLGHVAEPGAGNRRWRPQRVIRKGVVAGLAPGMNELGNDSRALGLHPRDDRRPPSDDPGLKGGDAVDVHRVRHDRAALDDQQTRSTPGARNEVPVQLLIGQAFRVDQLGLVRPHHDPIAQRQAAKLQRL